MIHNIFRLYLYIISISTAVLSITFYLINTHKSRSYAGHPRYKNNYTKEDVTVVMPVHNENQSIFENSIRSIAGQCSKLIVIGAQHDTYSATAMKYNGTFVTYKGSKRAALSKAIGLVRTKYVLFLDSDTEVPGNTTESMLSLFSSDVGGVTANAAVRLNRNWASYSSEFFQRLTEVISRTLSSSGRVMVLDGRCTMYRTSLIRSLLLSRAFRTPKFLWFRYTNGDDYQMTGYVIRQGYKAIKDYDIKVITEPQDTPSKTIKQLMRWTRSNYLSFFREATDGTMARSGAFYSFNVFYICLMPLIVFASFAVEAGYLLTGHTALMAVILHRIGFFLYFNFKRIGSTFFTLIILRLITLASIALFTAAIAERMSKGKKIKTLLSGGVIMTVMLFISIYSLLTFWKQDEWLTR